MSSVRETEAGFQRWVVEAAHLHGWMCAHFRPARTGGDRWVTPVAADGAGFPDLVLARPGDVPVFAELKAEGGRVRPEQQAWLEALGPYGHVWRPGDRDLILRILQGGRS